MSTEISDPRAREARLLAEAGRWEEAAARWEALASDLLREGASTRDPGAAAQALVLAADAWRREDRPLAGMRCLRRAMPHLGAGPGASLARAELAGMLADLGQLAAAVAEARSALAGASTPGERIVAADLLCGLLLEGAVLDEAEALLPAITDARARPFREAELRVQQARLPEAKRALAEARAAVGTAEALGGLRASLHEAQAELHLVEGAHEAAIRSFQQARAEWSRAHRRPGLFRAAAGEVRARAAAGQLSMDAEVDRGLDYARQRGLRLLEAELLLARGIGRLHGWMPGGTGDLYGALVHFSESGARWGEIRVRRALAPPRGPA